MVVNAKGILDKAKQEKYCIPHFNINNLEWTRFILEECNALNSPVILGVSESTINYMGGYKVVSNLVTNLVEELNISIPVVLHLDHGSSIESCKKAIDFGFTSVMIDASKYDLKTNIEMTKKVVAYAKKHNVSVEAEIGYIGNDNNISSQMAYAKVEDAIELCKETNVDFLAPAIGNVHGVYKGKPNLDFDRLSQIEKATNIPLVLHGGTGIDDGQLKKAIHLGICKLNINTELQIVWSNAVRKFLKESLEYDPRKIIKSGEYAMKEVIRHKVEVLGSINRK